MSLGRPSYFELVPLDLSSCKGVLKDFVDRADVSHLVGGITFAWRLGCRALFESLFM